MEAFQVRSNVLLCYQILLLPTPKSFSKLQELMRLATCSVVLTYVPWLLCSARLIWYNFWYAQGGFRHLYLYIPPHTTPQCYTHLVGLGLLWPTPFYHQSVLQKESPCLLHLDKTLVVRLFTLIFFDRRTIEFSSAGTVTTTSHWGGS